MQTQNILSIRGDTWSCDAEKPEFTKDAVMSEYSDIFGEELGHMEGKVHLESDPNVAPTVMLLRRVPVALIEKLKNEIDCFNSEESDQPYSRTYRLDFKHDCSQEARWEHSFVH